VCRCRCRFVCEDENESGFVWVFLLSLESNRPRCLQTDCKIAPPPPLTPLSPRACPPFFARALKVLSQEVKDQLQAKDEKIQEV
jgi:hypothetical protein